MPPEVPDSDAESDINSPTRQAPGLDDQPQNAPPTGSGSDVDFDQFLDPTQALSSSAFRPLIDCNQLDGSVDTRATSRINTLSAITDATSLSTEMSSNSKSKKRAHSALQDTPKNPSHAKRSRTYGSATRTLDQQEDLFALHAEPLSMPPISDPVDIQASTPVQTPMTVASGYSSIALPLTTSMASMGQYHSINLDFRGGLDVNANPFGSLSQVSVDETLAEAHGRVPENTHAADLNLLDPQALRAESLSFPERPLAIDPARLMSTDEEAALETAKQFKDPAPEADESGSLLDVPLPSMEKPPLPKKRGRKPKASRVTSQSPAPSLGDDIDELALPNVPQPGRLRQGTVDSVSQASEVSAPYTSTRKGKRTKSKKIAEVPEAATTISSPAKHPKSELNLSDEATIGLPKEAYKPRPSRSRSNVALEEAITKPEESPTKHASSQVNQSDEAAIGLPKEAYKPRPGRSRSKKVDDGDIPDLPPPEEDVSHESPAKSIHDARPNEETPPKSTKSNTKKGRKSKVKRAKTSAAALRKTDPMLSEGEEDVVWMESKPAPVKLDLPVELKGLKKEAEPANADKEEVDIPEHALAKAKAISVEIPTNIEAKNPVAEPKKRGRKPKKAQPKTEQLTVEENGDNEAEQNKTDTRAALAEKDSNARTSRGRKNTADPKKTPTVSPLSSPEPQPQTKAKPAAEADEDKENQSHTTPAKPKTNAAPSLTEKGPTKHSPIDPSTSKSGRKIVYRVGLSRRQNIPTLLRKLDRDRPPPKNVAIKQKERKQKKDENYDGEEGGENDPGEMRGADGMLVEWEF